MPPEYYVRAEFKVTVRKILAMRNHWYKAARTVVHQHLNNRADRQGVPSRQNLMRLNRVYMARAEEMPDPYPDTNAHLGDYVTTEDYGAYFDKQLPFNSANEINTAYGGDTQELAFIQRDMAIAFIRAANADSESWKTIRALMIDTNRNESYLSTLTPINSEYDVTYDEDRGIRGKQYGLTGITSMNERIPPAARTEQEAWRPANFWYSELHVSNVEQERGEELFAGFRSGAFSAYAEPDKKKRKWANLARAMGMIEAMAIQKLKQIRASQPEPQMLKDVLNQPQILEEYFNGTRVLPLTVVSIDLLSDAPTVVRGDEVMVQDHHAALRALDGRELTFTIMWYGGYRSPTPKKITTVVTMLDFNLAVNQAAMFVSSSGQEAANRASLSRLKNQRKNKLERDRKRIAQLKAKSETLQDRISELQAKPGSSANRKALIQSYTEQSNANLAEARRLERTDIQIEALWGEIKGGAMGEYVTPALLANLGYLLGLTVHWNCKSGKDRTGLADIESKFLARELYIKREQDTSTFDDTLPDLELDDPGEQYRHQQMLWESGSLQILERNTRGQSLKVADFGKVPWTYDAALKKRLGGEQTLKDLRGLGAYTLLVDDMLKPAAEVESSRRGRRPASEGEEVRPLSILLSEKAGQPYMLNDNVLGISQGQIGDDGMLIHPVAARAKQAVIAFPDGSEAITLLIDQAVADEGEEGEDDEVV